LLAVAVALSSPRGRDGGGGFFVAHQGMRYRRQLVAIALATACATPSSSPDPAAPASGATAAIAATAPTGKHGWYCGDRCGRDRTACERASAARYPGDLEGPHRRLATPGCRRTDVAYCADYEYTLADVTTARVTLSSTPSSVSDRTPRRVRECLPTAARCEETAAQRARHGYRVAGPCRPEP
jgi:hypothetical protein